MTSTMLRSKNFANTRISQVVCCDYFFDSVTFATEFYFMLFLHIKNTKRALIANLCN